MSAQSQRHHTIDLLDERLDLERETIVLTASMQPESGRIIHAGSDFSKEGLHRFVQNRFGSDLDGLVRFWPNASGSGAKADFY